MWLREKPGHYLRKSTESHHMRTLCQRILRSWFIHFLGTVSTAYLLLKLAITDQSPYSPPNISLITIGISPWLLPVRYHYITTDQFFHPHEEDRSHIQWQKLFHQLKYHMIQQDGKNLYIVSSSIISMYDINKTQNSILKMPWFHTLASHFSQNGHDTIGNISEWKLAMTNLFCIFGGNFLPIPRLTYWPNTISRKIPVNTTSGVYLIYPKVRVWGGQ